MTRDPFNPHGYGPRIGLDPLPVVFVVSQNAAVFLVRHIVFGLFPRTQDVPMGLN